MKVKELIDKLQKLNPEYDVKIVAYNENAEYSKKCNITEAGESAYYKDVNDNELYHYVILNYSFED